MTIRTVLAALVAVAGLVLPAGGLAPPATARSCAPPPPSASVLPSSPVGLVPTEVRFTRVTRTTTYGEDVVLQGQVVSEEGAIGDADVELWAQPAGRDWQHVTRTTSDSESGVFSFGCVVAERNTRYRVEFAGTGLYAASEATRRVGVARDLTDTLRQTGGLTFVNEGTVAPRYRGPVVLQHRPPGGSWGQQARQRADRSTWRFRIDVSGLRGEHLYRVLVPGDAAFAPSHATTWRITIR